MRLRHFLISELTPWGKKRRILKYFFLNLFFWLLLKKIEKDQKETITNQVVVTYSKVKLDSKTI